MIHGFDNPLVCEGIIGDGCGGDRLFFIENGTLFVYDKQTKESVKLLDNIHMPKKIFKSGCIITIECEDEEIKFDLSALKKV